MSAVHRVDSYDPDARTPEVGSSWLWEPTRPSAYELITVTEVKWNGEEWWVRSRGRSGEYWNDLSRFWEAVKPDTVKARGEADARRWRAVFPVVGWW